MTIEQIDGQWFVMMSGEKYAGPFDTNRDAWRFMDDAANEPRSKQEATSDWLFRRGIRDL